MALRLLLGAALCLVASGFEVRAQPSSQADLSPVEVVGIRDPEAFDVARSMGVIRTFNAIPEQQRRKIRLSFYVRTRNGEPLPANLRIGLVKGDDQRPLTLLPSGELLLPLLNEDGSKGTEITASVRRGTIQINYFVQPAPLESMTVGYLREALTEARAAWRRLYGSLLAWSVPVFTCAQAHYPNPSKVSLRSAVEGGAVVWQSDAATRVSIPTADPKLKDELLIDWGAAPPARLGGCVAGKGTSVEER